MATEWSGLVFVTDARMPVDPANLRRDLIRIAKAAEIGHAGLHLARTIYVHTTAPTVAHAVGPMGSVLTGKPDEAEPENIAADR